MPAHKKPLHDKSKTASVYIKIPLLEWLRSISVNRGELSQHVNAALEMYKNSKQV